MTSQQERRSVADIPREVNDTQLPDKTVVVDDPLDITNDWVVEEWDEDDDEDLEDVGARELIIEIEEDTREEEVGSD